MTEVKNTKTKAKALPPKKENENKKYYTVTEIAQYLNLTESWIYKLKTANKIPYIQIESKILFDIDAINSWLNEKRSGLVNG